MCFILTAIKLKEDEPSKNAIFTVLKSEQADNPHGTGTVCYSVDKKPEIWRGEFKDWQDIKTDLDGFEIVNYHFRQATIGKKTVDNVHFWKHGNWTFCHNGMIDNLGNEHESDSLVFFQDLISKNFLTKNNVLKGAKIKDYANKKKLYGRFLIINTHNKNIYFFGDFQLYLVNKSYLVFTSANASFENSISVMGLDFELSDQVETIDRKIEGVWMLNYNEQTFNCIFETFKEYVTVGYTGGSRQRDMDTHTYNFEEKTNLNKNEVLISKFAEKKEKKRKKPRTDESYIKEFYSRLSSLMKNKPIIAQKMQNQWEMDGINEMGRTDIEEHYWRKWIIPQLPKGHDISFDDVANGVGQEIIQ